MRLYDRLDIVDLIVENIYQICEQQPVIIIF
jgi:hypothetical protein